jgi:hypothetical protein
MRLALPRKAPVSQVFFARKADLFRGADYGPVISRKNAGARSGQDK